MFAEYYGSLPELSSLTHISNREFGFVIFDQKGMLRHRRFRSLDELKHFMAETVPSDAYVSCAQYEEPEAEMNKKGWLGADLIFDIDADHIPTSCGKIHDVWTCGGCGFVGKGLTPETCPACGSQKFEVKIWPCETCLESAKTETVKLLDILTRDFGFLEKELHLFFSGHRGYHVHVENEAVRSVDSIARKEIVDYVRGLGFDLALHGLGEKAKGLPPIGDKSVTPYGWSARLARAVYDIVNSASEENFKGMGLSSDRIAAIVRNKEAILRSWNGSRRRATAKGVGVETWKKLAECCVKSRSACIDTVVTTDIHRLIRLPDSLHGKTGLRKVEFKPSDINEFDPFKNAVVFKEGKTLVSVSDSPRFRLGDRTYGPYRNQTVELPNAAAVFLVSKGTAGVIE